MIIDELFEGPQLCPECGGISFSDLILAEKKDACYHKVKASAKVWPSAYASGRLVQCRKKGAANYGNKSEGVAEGSDAEAYKQKLLSSLPQMMRFYEKNVQGWKPSEEQMLAAVETGYTVMKHTGDVKQAGKAVMDELNTLHRMSQGQQGVAEGSSESVSLRDMVNVVDEHDPKYYAELSGSDISDKQFERAIVNAYKEIIKKQGIAEGSLEEDKGMKQYWAFKREWRAKHGANARVPSYDSKEYNAYCWRQGDKEQGMAEQQELDEKWSQKYKKSINCANPKGFSQKAHCAGRKKNEDVAEAGPIRRDPLDLPPLEGPGSGSSGGGGGGPSRSGPSPFTPVKIPGTNINIPGVTQSTGPPPTVTKPPNINRQIDPASDVPAYVRQGKPDPVTLPMGKPKITVRPGETQSQAMQRTKAEQEFGQFLKGQSGQTFGAGAGRGTVNPEPAKQQKFPEPKTDKQREWDEFKKKHGFDPVDKIEYDYGKYLDAMAAQVKQKGPPPMPSKKPKWKTPDTDIDLEETSRKKREQPEVNYDDEYDAMVARVKKLAGLGPMKTVWDPTKRVYRNMPTAQQPKK